MEFNYRSTHLYLPRVWQPNIDLLDHNPTSSSVQVHVELQCRTTHLLMNRSHDGTPSIISQFKDPKSVEAVRFDPQVLMCYDTSYQILSDMLSTLQINHAYHDRIIEEVLRYGRQSLNWVSNMGRKILPVCAEILVVRKYVRDERFLINRVLRESMVEDERSHGMIPASKSSIKALKRVRMEGGDGGEAEETKRRCVRESKSCMICLDELPVGSFVTRMPCSHVFHDNCIVRWLKESHFCPICRFEMPT